MGHEQKVALFNLDLAGHFNPMLALTSALVKLRWEVHFFAPKSVGAKIEEAGATWCHYGTEDWNLFEVARLVAQERLYVEPDAEVNQESMPYSVVPATLDVLPFLIARMAQIRPNFIMFDAACPWAWVLSQLLQIPAVCSMTALPAPLSAREVSSTSEYKSTRTLDATSDAIKAAYGICLNHNYSYENYADYTVVWSSRAWHKGNEEFPSNKFHYWGSLVPGKCEKALEEKALQAVSALGENRKLVFVSMGTVATGTLFPLFAESMEDFYGKVCAAAASMPEVSFIFSLGKSISTEVDAEGRICKVFKNITVPPNVVAAVSVNQLAVLSRASLFVTHCGMNSSSEAVANCVPVVAVPFFGDQLYNAARFEELGCGIQLRYTTGFHSRRDWQPDLSRISEESLRTAIRRVLDEPQFRQATVDLRARQEEECGKPLDQKLLHLLEYVEDFSRTTVRKFI